MRTHTAAGHRNRASATSLSKPLRWVVSLLPPGFPNESFRDSAHWGKPEAKLSNSGTKGQAGRTRSKGRINSQSLHEPMASRSGACWKELKSNTPEKYMENACLFLSGTSGLSLREAVLHRVL